MQQDSNRKRNLSSDKIAFFFTEVTCCTILLEVLVKRSPVVEWTGTVAFVLALARIAYLYFFKKKVDIPLTQTEKWIVRFASSAWIVLFGLVVLLNHPAVQWVAYLYIVFTLAFAIYYLFKKQWVSSFET